MPAGAYCRACGRPLKRPAPDGLGPKCRRATQEPQPAFPAYGYARPATRPPITITHRRITTVAAVDDYQPTLPLPEDQ